MKQKKCTQCEVVQDIDNFYPAVQRGKNNQVWHYWDSMCKSCRSIYSSNRRREIKIQAIEYLGGKCCECGLKDDPVVYDFHHRDPGEKDFQIGKNSKSFESIKKELDKCDPVCANCHRKLEYLINGKFDINKILIVFVWCLKVSAADIASNSRIVFSFKIILNFSKNTE